MTHWAVQHPTGVAGLQAVALKSDRAFPRHAHDEFGIGIIDAGAHRSWSGIGPVEAIVGDVITVNAGEMHDGLPVDGGVRAWRMVFIEPALLAISLPDGMPASLEFTRPALHDPGAAAGIRALFAAATAASGDPLAAEAALCHAVSVMAGRHCSGRRGRPGPPSPITRAVQRLDDAPEQPTSLAELSALTGLSRFQFLRSFSRATGATPGAYRLQRRLRLARRMLAAGCSPAQAAADAGFADQSHLTRTFRRQFGTTPARFRAAVA